MATPISVEPPRHTLLVRTTHWLSTLLFLALLISGVEILISHPRFYWGEVGNVNTEPLFRIPIPASRATIPTGYAYVLHPQTLLANSMNGAKIGGTPDIARLFPKSFISNHLSMHSPARAQTSPHSSANGARPGGGGEVFVGLVPFREFPLP